MQLMALDRYKNHLKCLSVRTSRPTYRSR